MNDPHKKHRTPPWRVAVLLFGILILVYVVFRIGPGNLITTMTRVGPRFFLMPLTYGLGTAVHAFGLHFLLNPGERFSLPGVVASRFSATTLNTVLPLVGVGGEPSRLLWMPPPDRKSGIAGLILDRTLFIISDAIFLSGSAIIVVAGFTLPLVLFWGALVVIFVSLVLGGSLFWFTAHRGLAVLSAKVARSLRITHSESMEGGAQEIDRTVRYAWQNRRKAIMAVLLLHFVGRILVIGEVWVGMWILGVPLTVELALIVSSLQITLSLVLSFVPSQLGVQEAAQAMVFTTMGLNPVMGVSLVFLQRVRQILFTPLGFGLLYRAPRYN